MKHGISGHHTRVLGCTLVGPDLPQSCDLVEFRGTGGKSTQCLREVARQQQETAMVKLARDAAST